MRNNQRNWKELPCRRQGLYVVQLHDGTELTAELWSPDSSKTTPTWWHYPADRPDEERKTRVALEGVARYSSPTAADLEEHRRNQQTMRERLDELYTSFQRQCSIRPDYAPPIPAHRLLQPGDKVEIGALKDAEVVEVRRDGQDVILKYHNLKNEYGTLVDHGTAYGVWHWTHLVKLADARDTQLAKEPLIYDAYRNSSLSSLLHKAEMGLDFSPVYQRGYVWTAADKQRYLEAAFEGRELGRFLFVKRKYPHSDEVLDGKQRLTTLLAFYTSQIAYKGYYWHQLSTRDRDRFEGRSVQFAELPEDTDLEMKLRIFLEVNAAGVPQSEEHLQDIRKLLSRERARKYLACLPADIKVADTYDEDPRLQEALGDAFDGFEYPDFSHLTVAQVLSKMQRQAQPSA